MSNQEQPPPAGGFGSGYTPPGYGPGFGPMQAGLPPSSSFTTSAMIIGIVSIVGIVFCGGFGLPLGIAAIVMGSVGRRRCRELPARYTGRGMAIAGLWCGIVSVVLNLAYLCFFAWILTR